MIETVKKHKLDIIVIASLLLLSAVVLIATTLSRRGGASVEVTVNGEVIGTYSLGTDAVYELNGGTNILTVSSGTAYMSYSDCPDHTCENTGRVRYVGETIVCLPNRITVTVVGESDGGVDFVS